MVQALKNARRAGRELDPKVTSLALTDWLSEPNVLLRKGGYVGDITDEEPAGYWEYDRANFEDPGFSYNQRAQLDLWD